MSDALPFVACASAYALLILAVRTILFVSTRRTKADIRREARRQARTARFHSEEAIPSPANDLTPEARHAVG